MKTAVEWLIEQYVNKGIITIEVLKQAQKMEKEQIIDSINKFAPDWIDAEKYYNITFKTN